MAGVFLGPLLGRNCRQFSGRLFSGSGAGAQLPSFLLGVVGVLFFVLGPVQERSYRNLCGSCFSGSGAWAQLLPILWQVCLLVSEVRAHVGTQWISPNSFTRSVSQKLHPTV